MDIPSLTEWWEKNGGYDPFRNDRSYQAAISRVEVDHSRIDARVVRRAFCAKTGLGTYWEAKRRAQKKFAFPAWANRKAIAAIYRKAIRMRKKTGRVYHVDHIVPLQHDRVCGLHCEFNLRIVLARTNLKKLNKFI